MFSIKEIKQKNDHELEVLRLIDNGQEEIVREKYGLQALPKEREWHTLDYKCEPISEWAEAVLFYILSFHMKKDRVFCVSILQIKAGLATHFNITYSTTKIHRALKELEKKKAIERIVQVRTGTIFIFKLTE